MTNTSDPVKEHRPILLKAAFFNISLQVKANAIVAFLPNSIPE
jgi:hypothetical protein